MAYLDSAAIIARVRAVLEGGAGSLRTIAAGTYDGEANESLSDSELSMRALIKPRYRIEVLPEGHASERPAQVGNLDIYDVAITVTLVRSISPEANDSDAAWDAVMAAAGNDGDRIAQALTYPGNMAVGGIVSGVLRYRGSARTRLQFPRGGEQFQPGIVETEHRFGAKVQIAPAV